MNSFETLIIYCIVSLGGADEETEEENYSSDDTEKFNTVIDTHKLQQLLNGPSAAQVHQAQAQAQVAAMHGEYLQNELFSLFLLKKKTLNTLL